MRTAYIKHSSRTVVPVSRADAIHVPLGGHKRLDPYTEMGKHQP